MLGPSSHIGYPIASVLGHHLTRYQEDNVDYPPDTDSTECEHLSNGVAAMSEAKSVYAS